MLRRVRERREYLSVILCISGETVVGWALVDRELNDIMVYVRKHCRRQGIGTKIMRKVHGAFNGLKVYPWCKEARLFFQAVGSINATE